MVVSILGVGHAERVEYSLVGEQAQRLAVHALDDRRQHRVRGVAVGNFRTPIAVCAAPAGYRPGRARQRLQVIATPVGQVHGSVCGLPHVDQR